MSTVRVSMEVGDASAPRDTSIVCVELEAWFLTTLFSFANMMSLNVLWEGTDEQIQEAVAAAEGQIEALMGLMTCNGVASIKTTKAGYLVQVNQDGTEIYLDDTFNPSDMNSYPDEQSFDNANNNVCAGVKYLVEKLLDDVQFALQQAQFVIDETKQVVEGVSALLSTLSLFQVNIGVVFDGFSEWATEAAELGISALQLAYADPAVKVKLQENLYCGIIGNSNVFTDEIYLNATDDLPLLETQSALMASFLRGFDIIGPVTIFDQVQRWYNAGALNEDATCAAEFPCTNAWCSNFDFTIDDYSEFWAPQLEGGVPAGTWVGGAGNGWKGVTIAAFPGAKILTIKLTFPEARFVDEVVMAYSFSGTGGTKTIQINSNTPVALGTSPFTLPVAASVSTITIKIHVAAGTSPQTTLNGVIVRGNGTNPFGGEYECD